MDISTKSSKKVSRRLLFEDLPPRVIIHDILTFFYFDVFEMNVRKFEGDFILFGYFKKDRSRNVWFVFSSVKEPFSIITANLKNKLVIDSTKLYHLYDRSWSIDVDRLVKESSKMYSLKSLEFCFHEEESTEFPKIYAKELEQASCLWKLFSKSKFPRLRSLRVSSFDIPLGFQWHLCDNSFFSNLKNLGISNGLFSSLDFKSIEFFSNRHEKFKNLKKLSLEEICLPYEVTVDIPKLERLYLSNCENIFVSPSENTLKHLRIYHMLFPDCAVMLGGIMTFFKKTPFIKSSKLRTLTLYGEVDDSLFRGFSPVKLEMLKLQGYRKEPCLIEGIGWSKSLCKSLISLSLGRCKHFTDSFFQENELPNLESLILENLDNVKGEKWKELKKLEYFSVLSCKNFKNQELVEKSLRNTGLCPNFDRD